MELMGCSLNIEEDSSRVRPHSSEISELLADNTKLISRTDWQPKYDLKRGLSETIEWHKVPEHREYYIDKNYVV
jgi:nucleoside-diphosphate-sugar epimerase